MIKKVKFIFLLLLMSSFFHSLKAQVGLYGQLSYFKPFSYNQYVNPQGLPGISLGVGLFVQHNEHWELNLEVGFQAVEFKNIKTYNYTSSGSGGYLGGAYSSILVSGECLNLEGRENYYMFNRKLGFGAGMFLSFVSTSTIGSYNAFVSKEDMTGKQPHEVNSVSFVMPNDFALGLSGTVSYEPIPQLQCFVRYDKSFTNFLSMNVTDVIGESKFSIFKAGVQIRFIRDYSKRRY